MSGSQDISKGHSSSESFSILRPPVWDPEAVGSPSPAVTRFWLPARFPCVSFSPSLLAQARLFLGTPFKYEQIP
jgi:hypothetical protein